MDVKKVTAKWGFGMAPISAGMQARYDDGVQTGLDVLEGNLLPDEVNLEHLSDLKGMFNRCLRQDQWDWFSVFTDLGEPRHEDLKVLGYRVGRLRQGLKAREEAEIDQWKRALVAGNVLTYLLAWQNGTQGPGSDDGSGWIYVLSTREQPNVLKIGLTTRSVVQRVREINAATGVLIPYAARKVFRVSSASSVETDIFRLLAPYRIRPDREFFQLPFGTAVSIIEEYLESSRMRRRRRGRIDWFDVNRRYGFIKEVGADNIFLHLSQVEVDAHLLLPGTPVEFDLGHRPQGRCALRVCVVQHA